jgi:hypothetical protein
MQQKCAVLKGELDSSTIIAEDFNSLLSIMDKTSRKRSVRKIED